MKLVLVIFMIALILGGCAKQPISTSLTELGSVSKASYGHNGIPLMQSITINGLDSGDEIGTVTYDPDRDNWRKYVGWFADFPDTMAPRLTRDSSYILHSWSSTTPTASTDIASIKNTILNYQNQLSEYYRLQLKQEILAQASAIINRSDRTKSNDTHQMLKALSQADLIPADNNNIEAVNMELNSTNKQIMKLQNELNSSTESFNKPGIIIARWETASDLSTQLDTVASALKSSFSNDKKLHGFVILGEPHMLMLYFGADDNKSNKTFLNTNIDPDHLYLTHYQLRAKYIAYAESSYQSLGMALDADISKLLQEFSGINAISKIDIQNIADELKVKLSLDYGRIASNTGEGILSDNHSEKIVCYQSISNCIVKVNDLNTTLPIVSSRISLKFFEEGNH